MPTLSLALIRPCGALSMPSSLSRMRASGPSRCPKWSGLLEPRTRNSAHASAEVLNAITTPTFGRTLALPFCTIVTTAAVPAAITSAAVPRTDSHTSGPKRDLGERRNRSEKKGDCRHSCEGAGG